MKKGLVKKSNRSRKQKNMPRWGFAFFGIFVIGGLLIANYLFLKNVFADMQMSDKGAGAIVELPEDSLFYQGKAYIPNPDVTTFLFLGIDRKTEVDDDSLTPMLQGQADTILLAVLDAKRGTIKVISIPRDTMVTIQHYDPDGTPSVTDEEQICRQYAYGKNPQHAEEMTERIITEQIFEGVTVDHYASLNLVALPTLIDDIGGVKVTMAEDYANTSDGANQTYEAGRVYTFNGAAATEFVLFRDMTEYGSMLTRTERQRDFIEGFYHDAKAAIKEDPTLIAKIYEDLKNDLHTDLNVAEAASVATAAIKTNFVPQDSIVILPGTLGDEVNFWDQMPHQTYDLDEEKTYQIMLDTWYLKWDGDTGEK